MQFLGYNNKHIKEDLNYNIIDMLYRLMIYD